MTVKLSQHKISRILKNYFTGMTQPVIAHKVGVDQSTVSLYSSRFSERASEVGLLTAGKEFNVLQEVSELRSLSVELLKASLTAEDARRGVKIIDAFQKLGVGTDQHVRLIEVCKKVNDPDFINAALKLNRIEAEVQMSYEEATLKFERINSEMPLAEKELEETKANLRMMVNIVAKKNKELQSVDAEIKQHQKEAQTRKARLEQNYEDRQKQLDVTQQEVKEVAELKAKLRRDNLDIDTLIKLAKEAIYGSAKS